MSLLSSYAKAAAAEHHYKQLRKRLKPAMDDLVEKHTCKCCGLCCWVRPGCLLPADVDKIAAFLKITPKELFRNYLVVDEIQQILCVLPIRHSQTDLAGNFVPAHRTFDMGTPCVFFEDGKCKIHAVKPTQCAKSVCWEPAEKDVLLFPEAEARRLGWDGSRDCAELDWDY